MSLATLPPHASDQVYPRILGRFAGSAEGPAVVCFAGLHGNEPMGVVGVQRILKGLMRRDLSFRGEFLGVAGNLAALSQGIRYIQQDLNRIWTPDRIRLLRSPNQPLGGGEDLEQSELLKVIDDVFARSRGEKYFLDLHTTSAESGPFAVLGDTLRNRRFARSLPVPIILGLEEQIDGALLEYANELGAVTYGFESGRHDAQVSAQRHEALLWLALAAAGCIDPMEFPELKEHRRTLKQAAAHYPPVVEVRHRHAIREGDGFTMLPGFVNFQRVTKGQPLARDGDGLIPAPEDGRILMPLYQNLGGDGFFIARDVKPFWLKVSRMLRRLRLDSLLHLLPGVRKHPRVADAFLVNPRIARFYPVEIFHLLGYRRRRPEGRFLVLSRRPHDIPPWQW